MTGPGGVGEPRWHLPALSGSEELLPPKRAQEIDKAIAGLGNDALFARWADDFELLRKGVHSIVFVRELMTGILDELERIGGEGAALDIAYLVAVYAAAQSVAIRRLIDGDTRSRSFRLLLEEMERRSDLFTRARQQELYAKAPDGLGDSMFDQFAGAGVDAVPPERFARLRADVQADLDAVKRFVDKHVAHTDRERAEALSWHELDTAVDNLDRHLRAIGLAAFGRDVPAYATPQQDWREPFRQGLFVTTDDATESRQR